MKTPAYFISPKGEIIYCGTKHITKVIQNPEKFGLNREAIEFIHNFYKEKIGQEGKAREQILLSLINQGWIRIRKYGDQFWTVNVNKITRKVKEYLSKWAKAILKGKDGVRELDPQILVKIDTPQSKVQTSDISSIAASDSFLLEGDEEYEVYDKETSFWDDKDFRVDSMETDLDGYILDILKKIEPVSNEKLGGEIFKDI